MPEARLHLPALVTADPSGSLAIRMVLETSITASLKIQASSEPNEDSMAKCLHGSLLQARAWANKYQAGCSLDLSMILAEHVANQTLQGLGFVCVKHAVIAVLCSGLIWAVMVHP